jgi:hypothetical protein
MYVHRTAIGGVTAEVLRRGLEAFAARADVEAVAPHGPNVTLAGWIEGSEDEASLVLEAPTGTGALATVLDLARVVAAQAPHAIRVVASGTDTTSAGATTLDYDAYVVEPSGASRAIRVDAADEVLASHPSVDEYPKEELWELLYAALELEHDAVGAEGRAFAFHVRPATTDPRLAELVAASRGASHVELTRQADGRVLLRMVLADGSRRLAFLRKEEAETFERLRV